MGRQLLFVIHKGSVLMLSKIVVKFFLLFYTLSATTSSLYQYLVSHGFDCSLIIRYYSKSAALWPQKVGVSLLTGSKEAGADAKQ